LKTIITAYLQTEIEFKKLTITVPKCIWINISIIIYQEIHWK